MSALICLFLLVRRWWRAALRWCDARHINHPHVIAWRLLWALMAFPLIVLLCLVVWIGWGREAACNTFGVIGLWS